MKESVTPLQKYIAEYDQNELITLSFYHRIILYKQTFYLNNKIIVPCFIKNIMYQALKRLLENYAWNNIYLLLAL